VWPFDGNYTKHICININHERCFKIKFLYKTRIQDRPKDGTTPLSLLGLYPDPGKAQKVSATLEKIQLMPLLVYVLLAKFKWSAFVFRIFLLSLRFILNFFSLFNCSWRQKMNIL
jgi:hypothetical protein